MNVITDPLALAKACASLSGRVALDTEFHAERRYAPDLFLVQIQQANAPTLLIDVPAVHKLAPLGAALSRCELVVHGGERDLQLLKSKAGLIPRTIIDTQILAGFCGLGFPRRLEDLQHAAFGTPVSNLKTGMSDWSRRPLSRSQRAYAAADVASLSLLATRLHANIPSDSQGFARAATTERLNRWLTPEDPLTLWRRIPAARVLTHRERERLRQLAAWRAREAARRNLGHWNIASDRVLVDLARRAPDSLAALTANRLTPKGLVKRYADHLIHMIQNAPQTILNPLASSPKARSVEAAIQAWALGMEARTGVAAGLLLPAWRLDTLVSDWQQDGGYQPQADWFEEFSRGEIRALLTGQLSLYLCEESGTGSRHGPE